MNYTMYMHTFPNGKKYIGITKNIKRRWRCKGVEYGNAVGSAIKKYGWDNIKHEILSNWLSQEKAEEQEKKWINIWQTNNRKYGYNLTTGGEKQKEHSIQSRLKMSEKQKGRKTSELTKEKLRMSQKGRVWSEEHMFKIRQNNLLKRGIPRSEETKEKLRIANIKKIYQYNHNGNLLNTYDSAKEASEKLSLNSHTSIHKCCRGIQKQAYGYIWKYAEEQT